MLQSAERKEQRALRQAQCANCLMPTAYWLLATVFSLFVVCCSLFVVAKSRALRAKRKRYCRLTTGHCLLFQLFVVCHFDKLSASVRCCKKRSVKLLPTVYCLLPTAYWLMIFHSSLDIPFCKVRSAERRAQSPKRGAIKLLPTAYFFLMPHALCLPPSSSFLIFNK